MEDAENCGPDRRRIAVLHGVAEEHGSPFANLAFGLQTDVFEIEHTDIEALRSVLMSLNVAATTIPGSRLRLKAQLRGPKGEFEID